MAEGLARRGHEVHVVTYHIGDDPGEVPFEIHRIARVPTYRRLSPGPTYQKLFILDALLAVKLRKILWQEDIDVIHAHHYEGFLASRIANRGIGLPIIFDSHAFLETELPYYGLGLAEGIKKRSGMELDRRVPRRASHVIATSQAMRDRLLSVGSIASEDVTVVAGGVNVAKFTAASGPRHEADPAMSQKVVVYAGNLASYQGIDLLLRAFANICEHRRDVRLKLVTSTEAGRQEELLAERPFRDRIELLNASFEELPAHLASAAVAVNPRVQLDGYPQKLLNYMAAGLPIVSFTGSGSLLEDGRTGLLVPNGDTAAFARSIERLLDDREYAKSLGDKARETAVRDFSWEAGVRVIEDIYGRLVEGGPSDS